jgi:3-methylcrotonyl-CoA carboxylase alpha subunit
MMEINRILIANRGEIALRIIKAARELGITTVAIYADLDGPDAHHSKMADRSFPLNGTELSDTYLNIEKIISIAQMAGVQAIHPGYGFLSENHLFAEACEQNGLVFIGPSAKLIRLMGNKIEARESVSKLGVAVIKGKVASAEEILQQSGSLEYPVLVKAASGGGGKGMRIVQGEQALAGALEVTSREAKRYFGNGDIFIEKYLDPSRHIEFQLLGDHHGNVIHLNERECSVQRRYQKIIEESPSAWLLPETRKRMGEAALSIASGLGYTSAGTIEFLVDDQQQFYFLEMNTRIQVEHPVTEMVTGIDLVREQIRIEQGISLEHKQEDVRARGHAIEARIYAEDPLSQFRPSPGQVVYYREPDESSIRLDSSLDGPARIFPDYDPMISKMIAWGDDRTEALHHLLKGLRGYSILGIQTNILFLQEILQDEDYIQNRISTRYCDLRLEHLVEKIRLRMDGIDQVFYMSAFLAGTLMSGNDHSRKAGDHSPWHAIGYWRQCAKFRFAMGAAMQRIEILSINRRMLRFRHLEKVFEISGVRMEGGRLLFLLDGEPRKAFYAKLGTGEEVVEYQGLKIDFKRWDSLPEEPALMGSADRNEHNDNLIVSPMFGKIIKINVKENDTVSKGDILMVIDSMKIENNILAPRKAKITKVMMRPGEQVELNKPLIAIE